MIDSIELIILFLFTITSFGTHPILCAISAVMLLIDLMVTLVEELR